MLVALVLVHAYARPMRWLLVVLFALVACRSESSARAVRGPTGEIGWFIITCKIDQTQCDERAKRECPAGYTAEHSAGHPSYAESGDTARPAYVGELVIRCKQ